MCLIFAVFGPHDHEQLRPFFREGWKRGPNAQRYDRLQDGITLGFGRLVIQDAHVRSMQPLCLPKHPDSILLYNGEIYRVSGSLSKYRRATGLDGEYILEGQLGGKMNEVHGKYAAVVIDQDDSGRMTLAVLRDKIGVRSLWYCEGPDGTHVFASDPACMPWPERMKEFPPGGILTAEIDKETGKLLHVNLRVRVNTYWPSLLPAKTTIIEMRKLFMSALSRSVLRRTRARDTDAAGIGFLVSGGIDSGLVLALGSQDLDYSYAWTMSMSDVFNRPAGTDGPAARALVQYLNAKGSKIQHFDVTSPAMQLIDYYCKMPTILNSYDETSCRASAMMMGAMVGVVNTKLKPGHAPIKCIMSGEGADETLLGYTDTLAAVKKFGHDPAELKKQLKAWRDFRIKNLHVSDVRRAEMVIAHASCEGRFPFLDEEFLEVVMNLPIELLAPGAGMDDLLEDPKLADYVDAIPGLTKTFMRGAVFQEAPELLPLGFLFRPKAAFSDAPSDPSSSFHTIVKGFINRVAPGVSELDFLKSHHPKNWAVTVPEPWRPWWVEGADAISSARDWEGDDASFRFGNRLDLFVHGYGMPLWGAIRSSNDPKLEMIMPRRTKTWHMPEVVPPLQYEVFSHVCAWLLQFAQFYYPGLESHNLALPTLDIYRAPDSCNVFVWGSRLFDLSLAVNMKDGKMKQIKYVFGRDTMGIKNNPAAQALMKKCLQALLQG